MTNKQYISPIIFGAASKESTYELARRHLKEAEYEYDLATRRVVKQVHALATDEKWTADAILEDLITVLIDQGTEWETIMKMLRDLKIYMHNMLPDDEMAKMLCEALQNYLDAHEALRRDH